MRRPLERMLSPIRRRLAVLVARAVVTLVDDARKMQALQMTVLADETLDGIERFQEYGFTSRPHPGAEAIALSVGGHRSHTVVVAVDDRRYRKKNLAAGECALYTDEGDYIHLKRGRIVEVVAGTKLHVTAPETVVDCDTATVNAGTKVTLATPETEMTGNLTVAGVITGQAGLAITGALPGGAAATLAGDLDVGAADIIFGGLSSYRGHTHPGDSGGTTGPPQ